MFNIFKGHEAVNSDELIRAHRQRHEDQKAVQAVADSELAADIDLVSLVGDIRKLGINEGYHENLTLIEKIVIKRGHEIIANLSASIDQRLTEAANRLGVEK